MQTGFIDFLWNVDVDSSLFRSILEMWELTIAEIMVYLYEKMKFCCLNLKTNCLL